MSFLERTTFNCFILIEMMDYDVFKSKRFSIHYDSFYDFFSHHCNHSFQFKINFLKTFESIFKNASFLKRKKRQRFYIFFFSESQTIEDFGETLHLDQSDVEHLRSVFLAVENGDIGMLKSLGIKDSELGDVKFFLEKLVNTGFLD